ncbi:MAG: MFS transporter [Ignavibacteriales bacterium]
MDGKRMFYGWWVVIGCFFIMAATAGIAMNSFPVAYKPLADAYGFSMADISMTTSLMAVSAMLVALVIGKLMKSMSIRVLMTICGVIYSGGFLMFAWSKSLTDFYICSVLIGVGAAGTYLIPISVLITNWFEKQRGLALALAVTGGGVGGMVFGPLMSLMIIKYGLSETFLIFGIIAAVFILPATLFIVRLHPEEMGLTSYGSSNASVEESTISESGLTLGEAAKTLSFWLLCGVVFLNALSIMGVQQHIPSFFENIGYSATFAAGIFAAVNGILILGKLGFGVIQDKFGTKTSMLILYSTPIIANLLLFGAEAKIFAYLFAVFSGMSCVFMTLPIALWTAEIMGKKDFPIIFSIMNVFMTLGVAVGAPITGAIFDSQGSYLPAWTLYLGIYVISMIMALIAYSKRKSFSVEAAS